MGLGEAPGCSHRLSSDLIPSICSSIQSSIPYFLCMSYDAGETGDQDPVAALVEFAASGGELR